MHWCLRHTKSFSRRRKCCGRLRADTPAFYRYRKNRPRAGAAKAAELIRANARSGNLARAAEILGHLIGFAPDEQVRDSSPEAIQLRDVSRKVGLLYGRRLRAGSHVGLGAHVQGVQEILSRQALLFPRISSDWLNVEEWTNTATRELLDRLRKGEADQEDIFQLLHALGQRRLRMGQRGEAVDLLARIIEVTEARPMPLGNTELSLLASLASGSESSLPYDLVAGALEEDRLPWSDAYELISTFRNSEEQIRMLNLVRRIGMDHGLDMLELLLEMARASGETGYAQELWNRIQGEKAAQRELFPEQIQAAEAA